MLRSVLAELTAADVAALEKDRSDCCITMVCAERDIPVRGLTVSGDVRSCLREAYDFYAMSGRHHGNESAVEAYNRIHGLAHACGDVVTLLFGEA